MKLSQTLFLEIMKPQHQILAMLNVPSWAPYLQYHLCWQCVAPKALLSSCLPDFPLFFGKDIHNCSNSEQ